MNKFHPLTITIILLIFIYLFSGCSSLEQEHAYQPTDWRHQAKAVKKKEPWANPYQNQIDHYYELVEGKPRGQQVRHRGTYKHSDKFRWRFNVGTW
jgi:hypothetical protein